MFSTTSQVQKNWFYYFHIHCQKTLWTFIDCFLRFLKLDNTRKIGEKFFLHWIGCLFFKHFCLQQPPRFFQKCSYMFHGNGEISLCTLITCCLRFVTLDITGKKEPKVSVTVKTAILWNLCFYRPLWSPKKCIYHVQNICQETLWTLVNCFLTFFMFDITG